MKKKRKENTIIRQKKQFLASVNMWGGTGTFKNKNTKKIFLTGVNMWYR
jgi:hypothetical protein